MMPKAATLRVARPTDHLAQITQMYVKGLGFTLLGSFEDHHGFDGSILGHAGHPYHLEFTHHRGHRVGRAPSQDNLLVFYLPEAEVWTRCCEQIAQAGFIEVPAYNGYWDRSGKTFEDIDGYRVVLQHGAWTV